MRSMALALALGLVALLAASCPNGSDPENCASYPACADCAAVAACSFCLETNQCLDDQQNCQGDRAQTPDQCEGEALTPTTDRHSSP